MLSAARLVQYAIETNRGPSSNTDGTVNYADYGAMHRQALADAEVLESALKHQQEELEVRRKHSAAPPPLSKITPFRLVLTARVSL